MENYTISEHAKQRYAERIMGKEDGSDVFRFVIDHKQKIEKDINEMLNNGELLYTGKRDRGKGKVVNVYKKGLWIILVGNDNNVITMYKVELGLGEDFNKEYMSKMLQKLEQTKNEFEAANNKIQEESNMYKTMIEDAQEQIKEYRSMIKNLEDMCSGYKMVIDNNNVLSAKAERNVAEVINALTRSKEF